MYALDEAYFSDKIEEMSENLVNYMSNKGINDPRNLIARLLEAPAGKLATADSINAKFRRLTGANLIQLLQTSDQYSIDKLDYIARLHLTAISDGYALAKLSNVEQQTNGPSQSAIVHHVYHHHSYYNNSWSSHSILHDIILWDWLMNGGFGGHSSSRSSNSDDENGMSLGAILLLIGMAGSAAVAGLYAVVQTVQLSDELIHGERPWENIAKLGVVGAAATAGVFLGMLIGASAFAMPALGAVLTATILAGVSFKAINMIMKATQKSENTFSMIDGDSRFKLTPREWQKLQVQGYNPFVVNEALRELAVEMKNTDANSMMFLGKACKHKREIIDTMRKLKSGKIHDKTILVGKKMFQLTSQYSGAEQPTAERYVDMPRDSQFNRVDLDDSRYRDMQNGYQFYSRNDDTGVPAQTPDMYDPYFNATAPAA